MVGVPPDFAGDQPSSGATSWRRHWQMYVGLTLRELQHDPTPIQHLKRAKHWIVGFVPHWVKRQVRLTVPAWKSRILAAPRRVMRAIGLQVL